MSASPMVLRRATAIATPVLLAMALACPGSRQVELPEDPPVDEDEVDVDRERLIPLAAAKVCAALDGCCDATAQERFFAPWVVLESFDDLDPRLPPAAAVSAEECPALVEELLLRRPFGAWLTAVDRGLVQLELDGARACLTALDASCGPELAAALEDPTCFALGPPGGGPEQRRMFARKNASGPCTSLDDGVGGVLYGTCDPTVSFCCFGEGECGFPDEGEDGACVPVSATESACSMMPLQLCATGESCGVDDLCHAEGTAALDLGEPCIDDDFMLLGTCTDGYCNIGGTDACAPRVGPGEACAEHAACTTGLCGEGVCVEDGFCRG